MDRYKKTEGLFHRGKLKVETLDDQHRNVLIEQVLHPDLQPGLYVEIGPAASPYFDGTNRSFQGDVRYLGIDGGKSQYRDNFFAPSQGWTEFGTQFADGNMHAALEKIAAKPNAANANIMWGDAQSLPLPDADNPHVAVREVFMRDVLLEAGIHADSISRIIKEQARILDQQGMLIIRETSLDNYLGSNGIAKPFIELISSLERAGFTRRSVIFDNNKRFPDLLRQFPGGDDDRTMQSGYYLLAQRGKAENKKLPAGAAARYINRIANLATAGSAISRP